MNLNSFIVKSLQLALVADQAYAIQAAPGASAQTLLQPNNFNLLLQEIATAAAPPTPPATVAGA